ncbi:thiamine-phosphate kinase [Granulicella rosea]|uniref:Thiamine-monophosphate kinase n=1 Tax=Granulicella rosea TaxID=474952 RepID=A0A239KXP1_9BACT|nr:thiamine-phosphate kinase [Granulicella rosea]SNT22418.1 thiamine-phosphate kinase [Granulicella rosea]
MPGPGKIRGELALIEHIRQRSGAVESPLLRLGIGDDCAVLRPPRGSDVLVTTDFTLEGRHFRRDWHTPESAGHRTLARGLSDLAAMGAQPMAAFLSLAVPRSLAATAAGRKWLDRFFDGLLALAALHKVPLAGGDTSEAPTDHLLADITLLGTAPRGRELRRSGARAGDLLYVTGALGGAAAELQSLSQGKRPKKHGEHPQLFPIPRLVVGHALLKRRLATACMDVSDGISTDLAHLCQASGVGAVVFADPLPLHPLAAEHGKEAALQLALHGGEDYELLFTAKPSVTMPRRIAGVPVTPIGRITAAGPILLERSDGSAEPLAPAGWEHLR